MKEGITTKTDKNGKIKYYDSNGKEVCAEDAFREVIVEVPDDGDAYGE